MMSLSNRTQSKREGQHRKSLFSLQRNARVNQDIAEVRDDVPEQAEQGRQRDNAHEYRIVARDDRLHA